MALTSKWLTRSVGAVFLLAIAGLTPQSQAIGQAAPIKYSQIVTALNSRVPNSTYRNKEEVINGLIILIKQRRVEKPLTKEYEEILREQGATDPLISAIRDYAPSPPKPAPTPVPTPVATPTPPDHSFLIARAETSLGRGQFGEALVDLDKAIELKADSAAAFVSRGKTHHNLNSIDKAVADFDKAIEIDPKQSLTFYYRALSFEKKGTLDKAIVDYQKAVDLDAGNELARTSLKKIQAELAKKTAPPESISLGTLTQNHAVRLVSPGYPDVARRASIRGIVLVEVKLDENGNVVSANAVSGHYSLRAAAEDAAMRSKFKPAKFGELSVKATGTISYRF